MNSNNIIKTVTSTNPIKLTKNFNIFEQHKNQSPKDSMSVHFKHIQSTTFESKTVIQSYRKEINKNSVDPSIALESSIFFGDVVSSLAASYTSEVEKYYSFSGEIQNAGKNDTITDVTYYIPAGETLTIWEVTISTFGYSQTYFTNSDPGTSEVQTIPYTITLDLSHIFDDFLETVIANSHYETSDTNEWRQLFNNAVAAKTKPTPLDRMQSFIDSCASNLWQDGLDQDHWSMVISGMKQAQTTNEGNYAKFMDMLKSFTNQHEPSHNKNAWDNIKNKALTYILY
jgi:hypothetical protein